MLKWRLYFGGIGKAAREKTPVKASADRAIFIRTHVGPSAPTMLPYCFSEVICLQTHFSLDKGVGP